MSIHWGLFASIVMVAFIFILLFSSLFGLFCFRKTEPLKKKIYCTLLTVPISAGVANQDASNTYDFLVAFTPYIIGTIIVLFLHWLKEKQNKAQSS